MASSFGLASADHGKINAHPYSYCNGQIKGNISKSGEKIYHAPGGQYYNQTKAEYCFKTIEQAKKAAAENSPMNPISHPTPQQGYGQHPFPTPNPLSQFSPYRNQGNQVNQGNSGS